MDHFVSLVVTPGKHSQLSEHGRSTLLISLLWQSHHILHVAVRSLRLFVTYYTITFLFYEFKGFWIGAQISFLTFRSLKFPFIWKKWKACSLVTHRISHRFASHLACCRSLNETLSSPSILRKTNSSCDNTTSFLLVLHISSQKRSAPSLWTPWTYMEILGVPSLGKPGKISTAGDRVLSCLS